MDVTAELLLMVSLSGFAACIVVAGFYGAWCAWRGALGVPERLLAAAVFFATVAVIGMTWAMWSGR